MWWRLVRGVAYQEPPLVPNLDEEYATEANMPPGMDRSLFSNIMAVFTWTDSRVSRVRSIDAMTMKQADLTPQMLASNLIAENS